MLLTWKPPSIVASPSAAGLFIHSGSAKSPIRLRSPVIATHSRRGVEYVEGVVLILNRKQTIIVLAVEDLLPIWL